MEKFVPRMKQSVVLCPDLTQQTPGEFILILSTAEATNYLYVDDYVTDGTVIEFKQGGNVVYACRVREGHWGLMRAASAIVVSQEDIIRNRYADVKGVEDVMKDVDPKGWARSQAVLRQTIGELEADGEHAVLAPGVDMGEAPTPKKPSPTGQYL